MTTTTRSTTTTGSRITLIAVAVMMGFGMVLMNAENAIVFLPVGISNMQQGQTNLHQECSHSANNHTNNNNNNKSTMIVTSASDRNAATTKSSDVVGMDLAMNDLSPVGSSSSSSSSTPSTTVRPHDSCTMLVWFHASWICDTHHSFLMLFLPSLCYSRFWISSCRQL